ncbi:MAG: hypothetical protein DMG61_12620 [Acidobacteria bacterium]|nr:MAG: hypothetical protein DMG61_12620 [Acidobacteriota bacterium]PYY16849.1 MAG: hypothetical protein DMG60_13665 [Acidobacteriota bacterium]
MRPAQPQPGMTRRELCILCRQSVILLRKEDQMPVFPADLLMIRSYCARNSDEFTNVLAEKLVSRLGVPSDQANVAASNCCRQIIANGLKGAVVGGWWVLSPLAKWVD